jgi:hypothetical protein
MATSSSSWHAFRTRWYHTDVVVMVMVMVGVLVVVVVVVVIASKR